MPEITLTVQPGDTVRFPGICAYSGEPALARMQVRKRVGLVQREVDVPVSTTVYGLLQRRSHGEERWQKLGWLAAGLVGLLVLALVLLFVAPDIALGWRVLLALFWGLVAALGVMAVVPLLMARQVLPEKLAVQQAVQIVAFNGRSMTFFFTNETFAARFRALNEALISDS